jgi:hypothetical protein
MMTGAFILEVSSIQGMSQGYFMTSLMRGCGVRMAACWLSRTITPSMKKTLFGHEDPIDDHVTVVTRNGGSFSQVPPR